MFHKLSIGTIDSEMSMTIKFLKGGTLGSIEESFITKLKHGDTFSFAGRSLELISIRDGTVYVKKTKAKANNVPSWMGGRMPLSSQLSKMLRLKLNEALDENPRDIEMETIKPLINLQAKRSAVPKNNEFLIEQFQSKDGNHYFFYPFEGRLVHEGMAALFSYRISKLKPISFSFAMNDYGFELLSDQPIPVDDVNAYELFSDENLFNDIQRSVNSGEMAKRKFRDIAVIGGLIFQGYPGEYKKARHLQSSASLLFKVFAEYEPNNILLKQSYREVFDQQMEEVRLRSALARIQQSRIVIMLPQRLTPLSFPIIVDGLSRYNLSSERLEDRIIKMQQQLKK